MEDCPQGLKDCMSPALGLEELLKQRITELQGKEESQVTYTDFSKIHSQDYKMGINIINQIMIQPFLQLCFTTFM